MTVDDHLGWRPVLALRLRRRRGRWWKRRGRNRLRPHSKTDLLLAPAFSRFFPATPELKARLQPCPKANLHGQPGAKVFYVYG